MSAKEILNPLTQAVIDLWDWLLQVDPNNLIWQLIVIAMLIAYKEKWADLLETIIRKIGKMKKYKDAEFDAEEEKAELAEAAENIEIEEVQESNISKRKKEKIKNEEDDNDKQKSTKETKDAKEEKLTFHGLLGRQVAEDIRILFHGTRDEKAMHYFKNFEKGLRNLYLSVNRDVSRYHAPHRRSMLLDLIDKQILDKELHNLYRIARSPINRIRKGEDVFNEGYYNESYEQYLIVIQHLIEEIKEAHDNLEKDGEYQ